jgi:DNA-binding XRE family transcriptional regulator
MPTFGDRIAKVRRVTGLNQTDIADMCDVSRDAVANWEAGKTSPPRTKLFAYAQAIAKGTGAPVGYLLDAPDEVVNVLARRDRASRWKCDGCGGTVPGGCKCPGPMAGASTPSAPFHPPTSGLTLDPALVPV